MLQAERDAVARNRVRYGSVLDLQPETTSKDQVAVVGVDGSMFVGNGSNKWEHQYAGETRLSDQGIAKWRLAFERRRAAAHEIGARYLHLVVPEKQSIMPTARWPNGVVKRVGPRPIEQIASLGMPELLYPLPALQSQAWRAELAWRGDSHWCASGMWFIFADLMARLWPARVFPFEAL
ncbi:MAG: hypothetical protein JWQ11_780, partial [Rhizobacter sp.]|nr:hypothetical protein [Rhizobacter sp.]